MVELHLALEMPWALIITLLEQVGYSDFVYMLRCCTDSYIISYGKNCFITYEQVFGM